MISSARSKTPRNNTPQNTNDKTTLQKIGKVLHVVFSGVSR
jgi:hypothetical protein